MNVMPGQSARERLRSLGSMQHLMECYSLSMDIELQLLEHRAMHFEDEKLPEPMQPVKREMSMGKKDQVRSDGTATVEEGWSVKLDDLKVSGESLPANQLEITIAVAHGQPITRQISADAWHKFVAKVATKIVPPSGSLQR